MLDTLGVIGTECTPIIVTHLLTDHSNCLLTSHSSPRSGISYKWGNRPYTTYAPVMSLLIFERSTTLYPAQRGNRNRV
jgi:hypothetical protein